MKPSTERTAFCNRLQQALRNANHPSNHPTYLSREFNVRFTGNPVTVHAARKWLVGESIPTQDKLRALAGWLEVPAEWLRFGGADDVPGAAALHAEVPVGSAQARMLAEFMTLAPNHRQIVQDFIRMLSRPGRTDDSIQPAAASRGVLLKSAG